MKINSNSWCQVARIISQDVIICTSDIFSYRGDWNNA